MEDGETVELSEGWARRKQTEDDRAERVVWYLLVLKQEKAT